METHKFRDTHTNIVCCLPKPLNNLFFYVLHWLLLSGFSVLEISRFWTHKPGKFLTAQNVRYPYMTKWIHLEKIMETDLCKHKEKSVLLTLWKIWRIGSDHVRTLKSACEGVSGAVAWPLFSFFSAIPTAMSGPLKTKQQDALCEEVLALTIATSLAVWQFLQENLPPSCLWKSLNSSSCDVLTVRKFPLNMLEIERALQLASDQNWFIYLFLSLHLIPLWLSLPWDASEYVIFKTIVLYLFFYI